MRYLVLLFLVPLGACSYTNYLSGADEHGGTVNYVTELNKDSAVQKAQEHCRQYNLVARVNPWDSQSNSMSFVCQRPGIPATEPGGV